MLQRLVQSHLIEFRHYILLITAGKLCDSGSTVVALTLSDTAREAVPFSRYLMQQVGLLPAAIILTFLSVVFGVVFCVSVDGMMSLFERTRPHRRRGVKISYVLLTAVLIAVSINNLYVLLLTL